MNETVGKLDDVPATAVVFSHLILNSLEIRDERLHVFGIGTAELVDVLVVVTDGNHTHLFVLSHQCAHERVLVGVHVLRFVNH